MDNNTLTRCFSGLAERLHQIKYTPVDQITVKPEWVINSITEDDFWTNNLEEIQDYLFQYKNEVQDLLKDLSNILLNLSLAPIEIRSPDFPFQVTETISPEIKKQKLKQELTAELEQYESRLDKLLTEVGARMEGLGSDRFTNAGFKITLDLTVEEIGQFFNLLYESGLIVSKDKSGNTILEKQALAEFLSRNFSSKRKGNPSVAALNNAFSKPASAKVEAYFRKLHNAAKI